MSDPLNMDATIAKLEAAKGDPDALALATLDIVLASADAGLKPALESAAVPHWFDKSTLIALLGDHKPDTKDWFDQLLKLTVVEPFHAHDAWNVHEVTRVALRSQLADEQPDRFKALGKSAASMFGSDDWPDIVERIYHDLTSEPEKGIVELRSVTDKWYEARRRAPMQALDAVLDELCGRSLLDPRARGYALLALGRFREERLDIGRREEIAREALELLNVPGEEVGLADAYSLFGAVLLDRGHSGEALSLFDKARESLEKAAESDSNEHLVESKSATLNQTVGRALLKLGRMGDAQKEFETGLEIRKALSDLDPDDGLGRHQLAVLEVDVADCLVQTSEHIKVEGLFSKALATIKELGAKKEGPEGIELDIGRLEMRIADIRVARGGLGDALDQYTNCENIFQNLMNADPDNFDAKNDLVNVHTRIAYIYDRLKRPVESQKRLEEANRILDNLIARDPSNPRWKYGLALLKSDIGTLENSRGNVNVVVDLYKESIQLLKELAEEDSENAELKMSLGGAHERLGNFAGQILKALDDDETKLGPLEVMLSQYVAASNVWNELTERDSENIIWSRALAINKHNIGAAFQTIAEEKEAGLDYDPGEDWTIEKLREHALDGYRSAIFVLDGLAKLKPRDVDLIRNIFVTVKAEAGLLNSMSRREESLATYQAALRMAQTLNTLDPENPESSADVEALEGIIAEMEKEKNATSADLDAPAENAGN